MDIKLIAIDLDGTLLDDDCVLQEENKRMIQKALDAGYCVVPTTGRSYENARREIFGDFENLPYYINANGTVVTDAIQEKTVYVKGFPKGVAGEIYRLCKKYQTYIEPYAGPKAYMDEEGIHHLFESGLPRTYCEQLMRTNVLCKDMEPYMENGAYPVSKFHIVCTSAREKEQLKRELEQIPNLYPISVLPENLEVVYGRHSKREGLQFLCEHLGIAAKQVMAIGDSNNDYEMLEWAGCSVAMANASPRIRSVAGYVTDTNNHHGVARALQRFLDIV